MTTDKPLDRWAGHWGTFCAAVWVLFWACPAAPAQEDINVRDPNEVARVLFDTRWDRNAFQHLLSVLQSKNSNDEVRATVVDLLKAGRYPPEVDRVIVALKDSNWRIRAAAADIFGTLTAEIRMELREEVLPPSLEAVKDDFSDEVREKIEQRWYKLLEKMLDEIAKKAPPALISALKDTHTTVKVRAAEALGEIGPPSAIGPLVAALREDDAELRRTAAIALGGVGDKTAVPALIRLLKDERKAVQTAAAQGLRGIGHDAIPALIHALNEDNWRSREWAVGLLSTIGDHTSLDGLAKATKDDNWRTRAAAVLLLGDVAKRLIWDRDDNDAIPQLLETAAPKLSDLTDVGAERKADAEKRKEALNILKTTGNKIGGRVFRCLENALNDPAWEVREAAAKTLGKIGARDPIPGIVLALKHENRELRAAAKQIHDMRMTFNRGAAKALNGAFTGREPNAGVRVQMALALGAIGHYSSIPLLVDALADRDPSVRDAVQRALDQVKSE